MMNVEGLSRTILDQLQDGVYLVDRSRKILYWNAGAEQISGYSAHDVVGTHCHDNVLNHVDGDGVVLCQTACPLAASIEDGRTREAEVFLHHKDGHRVPVLVRTAPIRGADGEVLGGVETFSENVVRTSMREEIEELKRMALNDPLTGLANRRYLDMALQTRRDELGRYGWSYGVLLLDIDHFKTFNDRYGHDMGDRVLTMVAKTLEANVRSSDLAGRWGGEEFLVVMRLVDAQAIERRAEELRSLIAASSLIVEDEPLSVTVSIGATLARAGETIEETLKRADALLYRSKDEGRNRISVG